MTILTFLTDRLADLCERIVGGYLEQMHGDVNIGGRPVCQGDSGRRPSLAASVGSQGQGQGQGQGQNQGQNQGYHSHGVRWGVFFGDYEVDSPSEWELLVKNLIILQLHALSALMGRVKEISGAMRCDTPWRKAVGTEKRIANLSHRMGPIGQAAWSPYYGNDGGGGGGGGGGGLCT
ncbi:hypothetical protein B0T17DRAFT_611319 [Bombardia bombarda]|uniref:Uncharacterized protein n=1 Tax=Bombardia bombarda TaxID=252184 RepID=A0AA40CEB7_9PEZI|nr:hypothetical protein B0T17DRAFT_611319 [Bombardia bombarda]